MCSSPLHRTRQERLALQGTSLHIQAPCRPRAQASVLCILEAKGDYTSVSERSAGCAADSSNDGMCLCLEAVRGTKSTYLSTSVTPTFSLRDSCVTRCLCFCSLACCSLSLQNQHRNPCSYRNYKLAQYSQQLHETTILQS